MHDQKNMNKISALYRCAGRSSANNTTLHNDSCCEDFLTTVAFTNCLALTVVVMRRERGSTPRTRVCAIYRTPLCCYVNLIRSDLFIYPSRKCGSVNLKYWQLQIKNTIYGKPGLEVIKLEFILQLKIKRNDWLLRDTCPQATNHCT